MESYTLPRTGEPDLVLDGEELASLSTLSPLPNNSKDTAPTRWHELRLFRCEDGHLVAWLGYRSHWRGDGLREATFEFSEAEAVLDWLKGYDPCELVSLAPERTEEEAKRNAHRNKVTRQELQGRWARLVTEAARALGVVERRSRAGRPKLGDEPEGEGRSPRFTTVLPVALAEAVERDAARLGIKPSEWLRRAAEFFLARER